MANQKPYMYTLSLLSYEYEQSAGVLKLLNNMKIERNCLYVPLYNLLKKCTYLEKSLKK